MRIENIKDYRIGVIGLGYVGLPLLLRFCEAGHRVVGFDIDENKLMKLNRGETYIEHISQEQIESLVKADAELTGDFSRISDVDAIIICLPTPLGRHREPDLSYVVNTMEKIEPFLKEGQILSLESTTYPGTSEEEILPRIERNGFKVGENFFLVYSPEREDPGNKDFSTKTIPKIVGGHTEKCLELGQALYQQVVDKVVPVSSLKVAEMTKLLENIHRAVNVGLVNEMKIVADKMGVDIYEVIDAASTKPFGFTPYYPGPGLGGHCIPIDPFYLTWKAREYGLNTRFIELSGEVNHSMPDYVLSKLSEILNQNGKAIKGSKILVLGIAYKPNVDDVRESPSVVIMEKIRDKGAHVSYSDPHIPVFPEMREHSFNLESKNLEANMLKEFDAVVLATDHDKFDYNFIYENSQLIVDCRGRFRGKGSKVISS